jgi:hypothetical protein
MIELIEQSLLNDEMKKTYQLILEKRMRRFVYSDTDGE